MAFAPFEPLHAGLPTGFLTSHDTTIVAGSGVPASLAFLCDALAALASALQILMSIRSDPTESYAHCAGTESSDPGFAIALTQSIQTSLHAVEGSTQHL
jgi:hypothetical protein